MKARSGKLRALKKETANTNRGSPPRLFPFTTASRVFATREVWPSPSCWCYANAVHANVSSVFAVRVIAASDIAAGNAAIVLVFFCAGPRSAATSGLTRVARSGGSPPAVTAVYTPNKNPWLIRVQQRSFLRLFFPHRTDAAAHFAAGRGESWLSSPIAGMAGERLVPFFDHEREGRRQHRAD